MDGSNGGMRWEVGSGARSTCSLVCKQLLLHSRLTRPPPWWPPPPQPQPPPPPPSPLLPVQAGVDGARVAAVLEHAGRLVCGGHALARLDRVPGLTKTERNMEN